MLFTTSSTAVRSYVTSTREQEHKREPCDRPGKATHTGGSNALGTQHTSGQALQLGTSNTHWDEQYALGQATHLGISTTARDKQYTLR